MLWLFLTEGLEQQDNETTNWCSGIIPTRNKILHKGLRDISPSETEHRIVNIEKLIIY